MASTKDKLVRSIVKRVQNLRTKQSLEKLTAGAIEGLVNTYLPFDRAQDRFYQLSPTYLGPSEAVEYIHAIAKTKEGRASIELSYLLKIVNTLNKNPATAATIPEIKVLAEQLSLNPVTRYKKLIRSFNSPEYQAGREKPRSGLIPSSGVSVIVDPEIAQAAVADGSGIEDITDILGRLTVEPVKVSDLVDQIIADGRAVSGDFPSVSVKELVDALGRTNGDRKVYPPDDSHDRYLSVPSFVDAAEKEEKEGTVIAPKISVTTADFPAILDPDAQEIKALRTELELRQRQMEEIFTAFDQLVEDLDISESLTEGFYRAYNKLRTTHRVDEGINAGLVLGLENKINALQQELDAASPELKKVNQQYLNLAALAEGQDEAIEQLQAATANDQETLERIFPAYEWLMQHTTALRQVIDYAGKRIKELEQTLAVQIGEAEEQQGELTVANDNLVGKIDTLEERTRAYAEINEDLISRNDVLTANNNTLQEQLIESREKLSRYKQTYYLRFKKAAIALTSITLLTLGSLTSFYLIAKDKSNQGSQPVSVASMEAEDIGLPAGSNAAYSDAGLIGEEIVEPVATTVLTEPAASYRETDTETSPTEKTPGEPASYYASMAAAAKSGDADALGRVLINYIRTERDGTWRVIIPDQGDQVSVSPCQALVNRMLLEIRGESLYPGIDHDGVSEAVYHLVSSLVCSENTDFSGHQVLSVPRQPR